MQILHLDPDDMGNPLSGGGPVRTYEIYKRLALRHEITVLTPTYAGSTPEMHRDGIRYVRLGRKIRNHGSSHHITYLASLPRAVRRFDHDLLVEDFMPPSSATYTPLFRHRDRPLIASVQWFFARAYTRRLKLPFHWGEEYGVRLYDNFVVLTEAMRAFIEARHPKANCRVVANGVDDALFETHPLPGMGILYLGRIEIQAKGIDLLLAAYAQIPEAEREVLTLAGTVQEPQQLQQLIDRYKLQRWVRVTGPFNAAERLRLLAGCRFVVMPSRTETFGMTIAEANAAARQTVTWDIAPMNEVASPFSPRVRAFDVEAYAAAMRVLLHAPLANLAGLGEGSREHARRWDWSAVADAQECFYLDVMDRHRHQRARSRA
ncbi:glycosyltransferase family 4 protein [Variovorax rhizosphaerae]|uniref:Glycosyltransferase family 4 protein n=1 Tax=Variovorax rhizosphaerae TaxID=1836200 RepID=A0ABU8WIV5_9BURK